MEGQQNKTNSRMHGPAEDLKQASLPPRSLDCFWEGLAVRFESFVVEVDEEPRSCHQTLLG